MPPLGTYSWPSEDAVSTATKAEFSMLGVLGRPCLPPVPTRDIKRTQFAKSIFSSQARVMFLKELPTLG